jgi:hypothetical protein
MRSLHLIAILLYGFICHVDALPAHAQKATVLKRQTDVLDEYDFIVVGAGTAGLTVADRLSENGECTHQSTPIGRTFHPGFN